jgi:hypothetical protein
MPATMRTVFLRGVQSATAGLALALFTAHAQAPGDLRLALVIGNAAYPGDAALANPVNDAKSIASTLRGLGFQVIELTDAGNVQMREAIAKAQAQLKGQQGIGMLYYAGHGLQLDWQNYMVPVDARLAQASDVPARTVNVNAVLDAFKTAGNRMNIIVLDACRDNPFGKTGVGSGKGLAQLDAPPSTLLAYSTAPGNVAEDGDDKPADGGPGHGLYTRYLLQELKKPVAKIEDVFKRVRLNVRQQSQGRQIPWESTSLEDDFYFNTGKVVAAHPPKEAEREKAFEVEKAEWDKVKDSQDANDFYAFLQKHPTGLISQQATAALERLAKAKIVAQPDRNGMVQTAEPRFRVGDAYEFVIKDALTGVETGRYKPAVTRIENDLVHMNDGRSVLTLDGGFIKNRYVANFDPPRLDLPGGEFSVGARWTGRTVETTLQGKKMTYDSQFKIVALEDVTVPAGTFRAYKIVMDSVSEFARVKLTYWAQPGWGMSVKTIREIRPFRKDPTLEIHEMTFRKRGEGVTP